MAVLAVARLVLRHSRNQHRVVGRIGIVVIRIGAGVLMMIACAPALTQPAEASLKWLPRTKMQSLHRGCLIADQGKQHGCKNEMNFFRHVLALLNSQMHWIETRSESPRLAWPIWRPECFGNPNQSWLHVSSAWLGRIFCKNLFGSKVAASRVQNLRAVQVDPILAVKRNRQTLRHWCDGRLRREPVRASVEHVCANSVWQTLRCSLVACQAVALVQPRCYEWGLISPDRFRWQ